MSQPYLQSITRHIERMLNTHSLSTPHLPHYGVPDIFSVYHAMPHSIPKFIECIRNNILRYERRITQFDIMHSTESDEPHAVLAFLITGRTLKLTAFQLLIRCDSHGRIYVLDKTC